MFFQPNIKKNLFNNEILWIIYRRRTVLESGMSVLSPDDGVQYWSLGCLF